MSIVMILIMVFFLFVSVWATHLEKSADLFTFHFGFCLCGPVQVDNVRLLERSSGQRKASVGTLYLSATHTIFVESNPETRKETWVSWMTG